MSSLDFPTGNYRYVPGVFQYSGAVAAQDGFRIERVMFAQPVPLHEGFPRIEAHLAAAGRPPSAFCACELRSPEPMSEADFKSFNELYVAALTSWGIVKEGINPVARSNVCPQHLPPAEPRFHAFSFTVAGNAARQSFVISGSGEVPEGRGNYRDYIVRPGDTSPEGLRDKAAFVLAEMERRLSALGFGWSDVTATQVYTVHDIHGLVGDTIVARGAAAHGLVWHYCRPPVVGLDYEMDCRGIASERVI